MCAEKNRYVRAVADCPYFLVSKRFAYQWDTLSDLTQKSWQARRLRPVPKLAEPFFYERRGKVIYEKRSVSLVTRTLQAAASSAEGIGIIE